MKRLLILVLIVPAIVPAVAGCGPAKSGSLGPGPAGLPVSPASPSPSGFQSPSQSGSPSPSPAAEEEPTGRTLTIQVWFQRNGKLFATTRTRPVTQDTSHLALTELSAGPSTVESAAGVGSGVAKETSFDIKGIAPDGTETVSFPASFYAGSAGDEAGLRMRQAQVVYTLTQFRSVKWVRFLSDGVPTIGGPFGRAEMADLLAAIVVYGPVIGQRVTSPITVTGIADVHESTVSVRVLNKDGKELGTKFTTASCSNRCHGGYSMTVSYRSCASETGPGRVEVYESSPADGSRLNVVGISVQLTGCSS